MAAAVSVPAVPAPGQPQDIGDGTEPVRVEAPIGSVTVYRGRAMVTRSKSLSVRSGVYTLRFDRLPASIQPDTLQARVTGPASVLSVEFETTRDVERPPALVALDDSIAELRRRVRQCDDKVAVIEAQEQFVDAVTVQATKEAAAGEGADTLDPEAIRRHLSFIAEERTRLLAERRGLEEEKLEVETELRAAQTSRDDLAEAHTINRYAIVSLAVTSPAEVRLDLSYLVSDATWAPTYNVRTMGGGSSIRIEYDALLNQATGEDWSDVALTLSTAEPIQNANPPTLRPLFVDRRDADQPDDGEEVLLDMQADLPDPAAAAQGGVTDDIPTVTYQMPRPVTVHASDGRQKRTRIADIDTYATFRHIAVPLLTDAVYVRGDIFNNSAQQLLPAPASVFIGPDYIGPTALSSIVPYSPFELYFGIDDKVKATRTLVSKKTESTGLFGGGLKTTYQYRIEIENGSGKDIELELWDRQPVSRSDQIKVELFDLSHRLSTDARYLEEQRPEGLLKWVITVPANARGNRPLVVTYGIRVNRSKDVETTPLP